MAFLKPSLESQTKTLEAKYYTSLDIFRRERELIFSREWICVGRTEDVVRAGDYFTTVVEGESLIVVRGRDERVRALYNVCRHRGTRMCEQSAGHFSGSIQCPYHAWTYGLNGELVAARNMDDVPEFDRGEYPLHQAACEVFEGFIFVNLSKDPQPFDEAFAPLAGRFSQWNIASLETARTLTYDLKCNWKLIFLNYSECYHCPVVHPQLDKLSPSDSGRNDLSSGPFLGGYSEMRPGVHALSASGQASRPPLPGLDPEHFNRSYYYTIFPSMLLSLHADYVMVHYVQPKSPSETRIVCAFLFAPETIRAANFDPKDAVDFWDLTNRQDWHVNELTQQGLESRAYTPGPFAHSEGLLAAFDRYYLDVMGR